MVPSLRSTIQSAEIAAVTPPSFLPTKAEMFFSLQLERRKKENSPPLPSSSFIPLTPSQVTTLYPLCFPSSLSPPPTELTAKIWSSNRASAPPGKCQGGQAGGLCATAPTRWRAAANLSPASPTPRFRQAVIDCCHTAASQSHLMTAESIQTDVFVSFPPFSLPFKCNWVTDSQI